MENVVIKATAKDIKNRYTDVEEMMTDVATSTSLDPVSYTHLNLYHYQILVKYRFEEELESALNQVLELTQLRDNKNLRVLIDSEPQNFV